VSAPRARPGEVPDVAQTTWLQLTFDIPLPDPVAVQRPHPSVVNGQKRCRGCNTWKPVAEFGKARASRNGLVRNHCKACRREPSRQYHQSETGRDAYYRRAYGVSLEWYRAALAMQNGLCAICHRPPDPSYRPHPRLVVDHDHETGRARGLLCHRCNAGIGMVHDDVDRIVSLVAYIVARRR
jgi:Recombination endonuclease VII